MLIYFLHIPVKTMYIVFFCRKNFCQFIRKLIYIIPEWNPFSFIIYTVQ